MNKVFISMVLYIIFTILSLALGFWRGKKYKDSKLQKRINYLEKEIYNSGTFIEKLLHKNLYERLEEVFIKSNTKIEITYEEDSKEFIALVYDGLESKTYSSKSIETLLDEIQKEEMD